MTYSCANTFDHDSSHKLTGNCLLLYKRIADNRRFIRPSKLDLADALAIWAEDKPDCKSQRHAISSKIPGFEYLKHATIIGVTGACLLDSRGHVVTVEGSGYVHASMQLCANPLLEQHLQTGTLVLSRQPWAKCLCAMAQSSVKENVVAHWNRADPTAVMRNQRCTSLFKAASLPHRVMFYCSSGMLSITVNLRACSYRLASKTYL